MTTAGKESAAGKSEQPLIKRSRMFRADAQTVIMGATLALFCSAIVLHFYGWLAMLAFDVAVVVSQVWVGVEMLEVHRGRGQVAIRRASIANLALILSWTTGALALFLTWDPSAWIAAMAMMMSLAVHVIFSAGRKRMVSLVLVAIPGCAMLYFMIAAAWDEYDLPIAIAATFSSFGTLLGLYTAWSQSQRNTDRMQSAILDARAVRQRLEFAVEAAGEGYFEIDFTDMVYRPNPQLARSLGWEPGPKNQNRLMELVHDGDRPEAFGSLQRCVQGDLTGWNQDIRVLQADGVYRWMHLRARVLEQGDKRSLIGIITDISQRKQMEADLLAAKEAAEASSRSKSEFLANMSHEIRTPLNGVLGMTQALQAEDLTDSQREKTAIILDSGKSLTALLNDVLDFSKIEAGKLEISPVPGDLLHTMKRVRQLFQPQAEEKGLDLSVRFDSAFPERLTYDPVRVRQCVSNLMSNAIKFTPSGRIEVAMSAKPDPKGGFVVSIDVTDTGIGMSKETQARLFTAFTQADGAITRRFGGTGLGLAISRQLARLMGGDLDVTSAEGKGSTFRLRFHAADASALATPASQIIASAPVRSQTTDGAAPPAALRGCKVLLTDDNAVNRQVIKLFLAPLGCDIVEATNGKEALDALATRPFDIVLLDVHMPVMDGKETIQRLRASSQPWAALPVIALTADAMTGDREKYIDLGMTDYLSKPVDKRELVSKLHALLAPQETPELTARTA